MTYSIAQLAKLAGVSIRTLHHYDAVGLLSPGRQEQNGYRRYTEQDALTLQQILFFREIGLPLAQIRTVLTDPQFDVSAALADQRTLLMMQQQRLATLVHTIDQTLSTIRKDLAMDTPTLFDGLSTKEIEAYTAEAKQRWGHTDAYRQSMERTQRMTAADWDRYREQQHALLDALVAAIDQAPESAAVQQLIAQHYDSLRTFCEPTTALYRGLADLYVNDPRFAATYAKYHAALPAFMSAAMRAYADSLDANA